MMLSLWTLITLCYSLTNGQRPDPGNVVFPPSFGMAGGLLSGKLGFVGIFDPSFLPLSPPPPPGFESTDPPSPLQGSTFADQVPISNTGPVIPLNSNSISINDTDGHAVSPHTDVTSTLPPSRRCPPTFGFSCFPPPPPPPPGFKSNDLLDTLFGNLPSQICDSLANASVNATTIKAATTTTTTKHPVLATAPISIQEILQMLSTICNHRVVHGKSQRKAHIGGPKSGNRGEGQSYGRGLGLGG